MNPQNDEPGNVAKFFAIDVNANGVDLVLHRPEAVAQDALEVTLVGSTNLVTATWEPFMNVTFPAGDTNVSVTVTSVMLDAHSVSNMCFFAFINSGDSDEDGLEDWDERFNLKTDPYEVDSDGDDLDDALDPAPAEFDPFSRAHWTLWDDSTVFAGGRATAKVYFSCACSYDAHRNCTEEAVTVGGQSFTLSRTFDEFLRPSSVSVSRGGTIYAAKTRTYDSENRVSGYFFESYPTTGIGVNVSVSHVGHLPVGMTYTFPNGTTMTLVLAREPGRSTWITRRDYEFNGIPLYWHRTSYDAEGCPTVTEDSLSANRQWIYNRRSELVGATGTQAHPYDYAYSYDSIGNRLTSSDNFGSATYAANNLNQYTEVNQTIGQSEQSNNFI